MTTLKYISSASEKELFQSLIAVFRFATHLFESYI